VSNSIWDKRNLPYVRVSYGVNSLNFTHFANDELPVSILQQADLEFSQIGVGYASGPVKRQRKVWTISAFVDRTQWNTLQTIYNSWDNARASGSNLATVSITDTILGQSFSSTAFFTSAPTLTKVAPGNNFIFITDFVLTEV
jgi:hypothetical protein